MARNAIRAAFTANPTATALAASHADRLAVVSRRTAASTATARSSHIWLMPEQAPATVRDESGRTSSVPCLSTATPNARKRSPLANAVAWEVSSTSRTARGGGCRRGRQSKRSARPFARVEAKPPPTRRRPAPAAGGARRSAGGDGRAPRPRRDSRRTARRPRRERIRARAPRPRRERRGRSAAPPLPAPPRPRGRCAWSSLRAAATALVPPGVGNSCAAHSQADERQRLRRVVVIAPAAMSVIRVGERRNHDEERKGSGEHDGSKHGVSPPGDELDRQTVTVGTNTCRVTATGTNEQPHAASCHQSDYYIWFRFAWDQTGPFRAPRPRQGRAVARERR